MTRDDKDFRERLLAAQSEDRQLTTRYQQEILAMLEHQLNRPVKAVLIVLTLLCLLAAIVTAANLRRVDAELGIPSLVFELAMAGCLGWIARGKLARAAHGFVLALLFGMFAICVAGYFADSMHNIPDSAHVPFITLAIITLILGWLPMVLVTISYYHNQTREKLLEIQYQLAELIEERSKGCAK